MSKNLEISDFSATWLISLSVSDFIEGGNGLNATPGLIRQSRYNALRCGNLGFLGSNPGHERKSPFLDLGQGVCMQNPALLEQKGEKCFFHLHRGGTDYETEHYHD
jgi:hypothetical protein